MCETLQATYLLPLHTTSFDIVMLSTKQLRSAAVPAAQDAGETPARQPARGRRYVGECALTNKHRSDALNPITVRAARSRGSCSAPANQSAPGLIAR